MSYKQYLLAFYDILYIHTSIFKADMANLQTKFKMKK